MPTSPKATYGILGPLEVVVDDRVVPLGGVRQRALLAILLLRGNQVVSTDHLIEELWGESPPPTARQTVQVYVSQLRRVLPVEGAPNGRAIETRAPGYLLRVGPGQLDLDRFEELVTAGRAALGSGDVEGAARILREALALWRGPPLADFAYEEFAQREIARLEERRLACVEERIEADLALGRHADLVGELESLVAAHPLRERLRGQLMFALYGSGRQAEALECYAAGRRALTDELGIEPGGALRELERRILNQDPELAPAVPRPPKVVAARTFRRREARIGRRLIGAGSAVIVAAATLGIVFAIRGGDGDRITIPGDSVIAIDAGGGRASAPVAVGASPSHIVVADGALWVGGASDATLRRVDPKTNAVVDTIPLGGGPDGIVAGEGSVWVTNALEGTVMRIRPETNTIVQTIAVPNGPRGIALGEGALWVASLYARAVSRIDPETGAKGTSHTVGGSPTGIAAGHGAVWVTNESDASVSRIDPGTGRVVQRIGVGNAPGPIAMGGDSVWVANTLDATVSRIDPANNAVTALVGVGEGPAGIAVDERGVWVANELAGTVMRIDPRTNTVVEKIATGQRPAAVALDGSRLWVAARDASAKHRGGTLRVAVQDMGTTIDQHDYSLTWTLNLTSDGLTAYRRVPGSQGVTLVPDLAVSIPTPTDGGRTYTFQVRKGVRYSTGETVGPEDFRRAIERFYRLGEEVPLHYDVIVGGAKCRAEPARCDLSRGIVVDTEANTVTFHLTRPDPNVLHYMALPFAHAVAPSAPREEVTTQGLPATGPYVIASHQKGRELRFVRNPRFREWSKAARPDGYADEIVLTVLGNQERMIAATEEDEVDMALFDRPTKALTERLAVQHPDRLRTDPLVATLIVTLNTTRAPFDNLDARRAVAYAIDREALVGIGGGYGQPACQILPPNFPSHEFYCPFAAKPGDDGRVGGPDMEEARRLVTSSGTAGARVAVNTWPTFAGEARYLAQRLTQIGYRARAEVLNTDDWLARAYSSDGPGIQAGLSAWAIDYPAPSTFFEQLRCGTPDPARFCDPAIDKQIDEALTLQAADPVAADKRWAQIDRALTDKAAWIGYATPKKVQFLGERVGNYQFHPVFWQMLDQLWVQ